VTVLEPDVNHSDWDCNLSPSPPWGARGFEIALRLGFRLIKGLRHADAEALTTARRTGGPFRDAYDLWRRSGLTPAALQRLAEADAFRSLGLDRRAALWAIRALGPEPLPLFARLDDPTRTEPPVRLPDMALGEHVVEDYASLSLSLKCHPLALLRDALTPAGIVPARRLGEVRHGARLTVAGLVLVRQRPGSAKGVVFLTLEDETGVANLIVVPPVLERFRTAILTARLLAATGRVERQGEVIHLLVDHLTDQTHRLRDLTAEPASRHTFPDGRNFR
jgi:error-prone DNA polymerase